MPAEKRSCLPVHPTSRAAFDGNVEANLLVPIPQPEFRKIVDWIEWIESRCKPVSEDWLEQYVEAKRVGGGTKPGAKTAEAEAPVVPFKLLVLAIHGKVCSSPKTCQLGLPALQTRTHPPLQRSG